MNTKPRSSRSTKIFCLALSFASISPQAYAWGDLGHSIVGEVAERNLKPSTLNFVRGILGVEPLATAAVWPDHVRDDLNRFGHHEVTPSARDADVHDFSEYHFCEVPSGTTYKDKHNHSAKDCYGAILGAQTILKSAKESREAKMIALRYLVHVVGDIHQPLHVGNGHDLGGNVCQIRWQRSNQESSTKMNLHSFWDDTIVKILGESYADPSAGVKPALYSADFVKQMTKRHPEMFAIDAKSKFGSDDLDAWLSESQKMRESGVYADDPEKMKAVAVGEEYLNRPYCLWFSDQNAGTLGSASKVADAVIPTIGADYVKSMAPVAEMQLLKAGVRLAATLDRIADQALGARPSLGDSVQEAILVEVQSIFKDPKASLRAHKAH